MIKFFYHTIIIRFSLVLLFISAINVNGFTQTTFWTETFSNACASGCSTYSGPNGVWNMNVSTGANSASYNVWFVSCADEGYLAGNCGTGCVTNNSSLHVGSQTMGDIGAAYDAAQTTNRRTESPNINTTVAGTNAITLSFTYIEFGEAGVDFCQLYYSINGGTTWLVLENPIPQALCCGSVVCSGQEQGLWTNRSYILPATCNNITNLKIAFNWINNGVSGTDPSFAVDNITLQYTAPMPVTWLTFEGFNVNNITKLSWQTASEINNDYFEIQQSIDGIDFTGIGKVKGNGSSSKIQSYVFYINYSEPEPSYYRLKQVDFNGDARFSKVIVIKNNKTYNDIFSLETNLVSNLLSVSINSAVKSSCYIEINDVLGNTVVTKRFELKEGDSFIKYDVSFFKSGMYYIVLRDNHSQKVYASNKFVKL